MEHIFDMVKLDDSMQYAAQFSSPAAKAALEQSSRMFWKIDGSCGILVLDIASNQLSLYQRQDTRGKEPGPTLVPLPDSGNPTEYTFHTYYMEKIALGKSDGKKQRKTKEAVLDLLSRHKETLQQVILDHSDEEEAINGRPSRCLSVEIVGTKYAQTAGVHTPVAIAPHCLQKISMATLPRTLDETRELLISSNIVTEGVVVEFKGKYWKCVSKLLDPSCVFGKDKSKAMPPRMFYE